MIMRDMSSNHTVPSFARGISILVVDSDTTSLMYLGSLLELYSYKVTTTELASVALSMIREKEDRFELVIANIDMIDMDCLSFLRVVLKKNIPVIFVAPKRNVVFAQTALAEGASFFLEKPIASQDLKYIWQHVFKTYTTKQNRGKAPEQAGAHSVLHGKEADNYNWPNENRVGGSLISTSTEQYSNESLQQEGSLKGKRLLINDDQRGNRKEKKFRSNDHPSQAMNLSAMGKSLVNQMETGNDSEMDGTNRRSDKKVNRRLLWTSELHRKFTQAVSELGDKRARPKKILEKMNVANLTQRQVASHLQKYKTQVQKISDARETTVPSVPSTLQFGPPFGRSTTGSSLNSQLGQRHRAIPGPSQGLDLASGYYLGSSGNVFNAGQSLPDFTERRSFEVESMADSDPPANAAPPACMLNQNLQPSLDDLMKFLDEDEEGFKSFGTEPNPSEVDRYCEWLNGALLEENGQPSVEEPHQKQ